MVITGGEPANGSTESLSVLISEPTATCPPPPPHDLRKSEDLVPLVGDGNRRRSRIIVSCDPNTVVFKLAVDPWAKSSSDSNLMGDGSRNHVVMGSVNGAPWEEMASKKERIRLVIGEGARSGSSGEFVSWFSVLDA